MVLELIVVKIDKIGKFGEKRLQWVVRPMVFEKKGRLHQFGE